MQYFTSNFEPICCCALHKTEDRCSHLHKITAPIWSPQCGRYCNNYPSCTAMTKHSVEKEEYNEPGFYLKFDKWWADLIYSWYSHQIGCVGLKSKVAQLERIADGFFLPLWLFQDFLSFPNLTVPFQGFPFLSFFHSIKAASDLVSANLPIPYFCTLPLYKVSLYLQFICK